MQLQDYQIRELHAEGAVASHMLINKNFIFIHCIVVVVLLNLFVHTSIFFNKFSYQN